MRKSLAFLLLAGALGGGALQAAQDAHSGHAMAPGATLASAIAAPGRSPENRARDRYRHPAETLSFFGVKPTDTVVELIPGGGWYSEILGPYLADKGKLYAAQSPGKGADALRAKFAANPAYSKIALVPFPETGVAPGSVDVVLTFRNMHNLTMRGDGTEAKVMAGVFAMLKPGGTFGVVEHRLPEAADISREKESGYLKTATVRRIVEGAGFEYVGASEVNANAKDKTDYPKGVWTLPPNYAEGETDRAKYAAIGESDRMTLKFRKPLK